MPNKFQKSVLERQKTEAERRQSGVPQLFATTEDQVQVSATAEDACEQDGSVAVARPLLEASVQPVASVVLPPVKSASDISAFIRPRTARAAKNKTFYLDNELIQAIQDAAATQKVAESRLVNDILRSVLGI